MCFGAGRSNQYYGREQYVPVRQTGGFGGRGCGRPMGGGYGRHGGMGGCGGRRRSGIPSGLFSGRMGRGGGRYGGGGGSRPYC
ncbi:hypothetical protein DL766_009397 [Monosporascus sp. MC13-8B]|uniref:Uncharacterized protein n=1 Tax=Monosporascus cannonballus TaxID=155416 RepID=A0ABY0HAE7_9PEZI|nr:hypothetical protein DL762_003507 [Monosporascus cannonballus]RYP15490.1 hypothetical protein DL766_009397 [Monosporascus sp. MC13-8B]